jgi:2-oxo-3-hexenedioate decarboxylase
VTVIQDETLQRRLSRGERLAGISLAPPGADTPLASWLTDAMALPAGAPVPQLTQPRAQPHIVFLMRDRLAGPGVTAPTALAAVGSVLGGVEVTDSQPGEPGATSCFVTGPVLAPPAGLDLSLEACLLEVNGEITNTATGAAAHGHPAQALALAANHLAHHGLAIEPGWLVLTAPLTPAVPLPPRTSLAAHFTHLGSLHLPTT